LLIVRQHDSHAAQAEDGVDGTLTKDGRIVCATLNPKKNPNAPDVMVVSSKPNPKARGAELCKQHGAIPLFIKKTTDQWQYKGMFEVNYFITDRSEVAQHENKASGPLSRVIFLRAAGESGSRIPAPDLDGKDHFASEGRRLWVAHFRRERHRGLVALKKRYVLQQTGRLRCEVCGFDFATFYEPYAIEFCEAHHRKPLATAGEATMTKPEDLAILCSNCHRVIHLIDPMPTVEALAEVLHRNKR